MKDYIGNKIKRIRLENSLTQDEFARSLGYKDKSMIAHIEKGDSDMTYEKICLLIEKYHVNPSELFDKNDENMLKTDVNNIFSRFSLLVGIDAINKLKTKKVLVFGLGGVGGNVCDALARSGVGDITIVDNDIVNETNINRQLIANVNEIGKTKVDVMEKRLKSINPEIKVNKIKSFYLPNNSSDFDFSKYDYVIDAIDTVSAKIDIIYKCHIANIPVISALGCGNKMDPSKLEVSDLSKTSYDPLAKVLRRELRKLGIIHSKVVYSKEEPIKAFASDNSRHAPGSSPFVPPVAGILIAKEVVIDLLENKETF